MTWYLAIAYALATGAFIAAGAAVIIVMSFANALAHNNIRVGGAHREPRTTGRHAVTTDRPPP